MIRVALILLLATTAHGAFYLETGDADLSASYDDCQAYATEIGAGAVVNVNSNSQVTGCNLDVANTIVQWNRYGNAMGYPRLACSVSYKCVQSDAPMPAVKFVTSDANVNSLSPKECAQFFTIFGFGHYTRTDNYYPVGCIKGKFTYDHSGTTACSSTKICVQRDLSVPGCRNELASNYNATATVDDGSCVAAAAAECPEGRVDRCIKEEYVNV